jgi:diacylglycerol O-acyltransferase
VNDVILALITATIRRYCELHGDPVRKKLLRIMVPVNLRESISTSELGNRISLVPVTIPLDIRPPLKLLTAAHKRTGFLKRVHAAELVSLAGGLIGMFPTTVQGLAGPIMSQLPVAPFNLVCTNVPGPQFPLYLLGHKMLHCYPYVPVGGEMALNCAILSYNGTMYFGFSGDVHAAPDLRRLEHLLNESFAELRDAARIKPQQTKRMRPRSQAATVAPPPLVKKAPKPAAAAPAEAPGVSGLTPTAAGASPIESKRPPEPASATEQEHASEQLAWFAPGKAYGN